MTGPARAAHLVCAIWLIFLSLAPEAAADENSPLLGPIRSRNHHPLFAILLTPPPEKAALSKGFSWEIGVNHSNIFAMGSEGDWYIHMDKEVTELDISLRAPAFGGSVEIGAEVSGLSTSAGFMDPYVRSYHEAIGVEGYDWQDHFPDNSYVDKLYLMNDVFWLGEGNKFGAGDATFWIKGLALEGDGYRISWQGLAQAPTGPWRKGLGSGGWEAGARVLADIEYMGAGVYLSLGAYLPGDLKGQNKQFAMTPMYTAFSGFEWTLSGGWAFLAQLTFTSSPMRGAGFRYFEKPWMDFTAGFKKAFGRGNTVNIGLSENLNQTAPDFTIHISVSM